MTFSGYYKKELKAMNKPGWRELLRYTDIFLEGPFEIDNPVVLGLNQRTNVSTF